MPRRDESVQFSAYRVPELTMTGGERQPPCQRRHRQVNLLKCGVSFDKVVGQERHTDSRSHKRERINGIRDFNPSVA